MQIRLIHWIILACLALTWGSSFILMKLGMFDAYHHPVFSASQVAAMRMFIAATILLPLSVQALRKINSKKTFFGLLLIGFCGNFFPAFLFTYAETGISSGLTGMLNSLTPLFTLLIGVFVFRDSISTTERKGLFIASIGVIGLLYFGSNQFNGELLAIGAVALATILYAISVNAMRHLVTSLTPVETTACAFSLTLPFSSIILFSSNAGHVLVAHQNGIVSFSFICILGIIGTAGAVVLFNKLITETSSLFASSVTYLIPIVAVLWGFIFGETFNSGALVSISIVLLGILLMSKRENKK